MPEATYEVHGVDCSHCATAIVEFVSDIEGVTSASVDRTVMPARLSVSSTVEIEKAALIGALNEAGGGTYTLGGVVPVEGTE